MSVVVSNNNSGTIEFTRDGQAVFTALVGPAASLLGSRVGMGFGEIAGIVRLVASAPLAGGTLTIEQGIDGTNYDSIESFPATIAGGGVPFAVKIVGKFVRARWTPDGAVTQDVRFWAQMKPFQSP